MRPLDPRLIRQAGSARWRLAVAAAATALDAVLLVAAAGMIAKAVAAVIADGADLGTILPDLVAFVVILAGRALFSAISATLPQQAAAAIKLGLRRDILAAAVAPQRLAVPTGEVAAVAGRGLDALDPYFARYVPELIRAATIPIAVLIALLASDLIAGLIVAATLPLIPLFGAFVGAFTQRQTRRQWRALETLSHHFLDVVSGLPTLKVFGRAEAQASTIARVTERHRRTTMSTLRIAMLSALVLELAATLSVALVAVSVGLRLVHGGLSLQIALFLLILAPEAYLPLRRAAAEYHAAAEGIAAAERAFAIIDAARPAESAERSRLGVSAPTTLTLEGVTVRFPDRDTDAVHDFNAVVRPGTITAISGPSGSGKSTLLHVLLGLCDFPAGSVRINGHNLDSVDPVEWHRRVAWLPQRPQIVNASIADNIALGYAQATADEIRIAATRAHAAEFIDALPKGYATPVREAGNGLSLGQRQRIALARVFLRTDASVVLLDEPTAHLDLDTEALIAREVGRLAAGRTVLLVTHRPALLELADEIIDLTPAVAS